jgi:hypothetical protein
MENNITQAQNIENKLEDSESKIISFEITRVFDIEEKIMSLTILDPNSPGPRKGSTGPLKTQYTKYNIPNCFRVFYYDGNVITNEKEPDGSYRNVVHASNENKLVKGLLLGQNLKDLAYIGLEKISYTTNEYKYEDLHMRIIDEKSFS